MIDPQVNRGKRDSVYSWKIICNRKIYPGITGRYYLTIHLKFNISSLHE